MTKSIPDWNPRSERIEKVTASTPEVLVLEVRDGSFGPARFFRMYRRTGGYSSSFGPENLRLKGRYMRAFWQSLGGGGESPGYPFLFQRQLRFGPLDGAPDIPDQFEIYAVTGLEEYCPVWRYPSDPTGNAKETLMALSPAIGGLLPVGSAATVASATRPGAIQFLDARTGTPVERSTPSGQDAFQRAIKANNSRLVQLGKGTLYQLDTGQSFTFPGILKGEGVITPWGVTEDRALWISQGDDGYTGHSAWPDILLATDANGKILWKFPGKSVYPGYETANSEAELEEILKGFRTVEKLILALPSAAKEAVAVVHAAGIRSAKYLYGIRVRDGKTLWELRIPDAGPGALDNTEEGFFLLRTDIRSNHARLEYRSVAAGTLRKSWSLPDPSVTWISAVGDDLLTVDKEGTVRIYSCKKLLGSR